MIHRITKWRCKWRSHNRVMSRTRSQRTGQERMIGSAKEKSVVDKTEFVTFVLVSLKLFTALWKVKGLHTRRKSYSAIVWRWHSYPFGKTIVGNAI